MVAGTAFIFPAVILTLIFAWLYVSYGSIPEIDPLFFAIKPAVLAVILSAICRLA
jgi:chromate transporter